MEVIASGQWLLSFLSDAKHLIEGLLLARNRPLVSRQRSELDLLCEPKRVIYFNPEVTNGRLDLRVTEQQLDRSQVAGLPIELGDFGSSQRVGAEAAIIEPDVADPPMDDAGLLPY